jgi:tetratricopeptide (TPR) repeat protein
MRDTTILPCFMAAVAAMAAAIAPAATAQNTFGGRVVAAGAEASEVLVSLERQNGQIVAQAFTDSRGTFRFNDISAADQTNDRYVYLVVEEEGFKPYRERLDGTLVRGGGGGVFTIYLEFGDSTAGGGGTAVDVRQLQAEIPDEAVREYERAQEDTRDGDHEDAAERLERAVELAPDYYDAWIDLGGQYDAIGRLDDAKAAYERAAEVNPGGALARLNLGALHYQEGERRAAAGNAVEAMGSFAEARTRLEEAVRLDPTSASGRFYLGAAMYRLTLYPDAEAALTAAIQIDEGYPQARLLLINVYTRQQRYDAALEQATAFIEENPNAPERPAIERVKSQIEAALGRSVNNRPLP